MKIEVLLIGMWMMGGIAQAAKLPDTLFAAKGAYTFYILTKDLRYGIISAKGTVLVGSSPHQGVMFAGGLERDPLPCAAVEATKQTGDSLLLTIQNNKGERAALKVVCWPDYVQMNVLPTHSNEADTVFTIDFCTAGAGPAYGLGDHGGYGNSTAITDFTDNDFGNRDNGHRFISTFSIFPQNGFAQVLFEKKTKRVVISTVENRLGATGVKDASVYYLTGSPKIIYKTYKRLKIKQVYPDFEPATRFFDVGYEAFGSLGWNTFQQSVEDDVQKYLDHGYQLKWAVVGSGFWKGERRKPFEGSTTSFGIWDDEKQAGRQDGLPSPRYPDVPGFKAFFSKKGIDLLLGLRINFKATPELGGNYDLTNDGRWSIQGMGAGYFIKNSRQRPETYRVNFPVGNVFLLNGEDKKAVQWYSEGVNKWEAKGFKEDLMLKDGKKLNNDAKVDPVNRELMARHYLVMARNGAYGVPGDVLRLEDTQYGQDQDRPVINGLNYAASGVAAVYLDIVAGKYLKVPLTTDQETYFVRNAMLAAVSPVMAMGLGPWHLKNERYQAAVKKAADWHARYAAYIHSEAVRSFKTGYPFTMTPLPIAFPDDTTVYELASKQLRQYAWMLGESLLAIPLYGNDYATANSRTVYLPKGSWMDYESKEIFEGPRTLPEYPLPVDKLPLFIGGKGLLVEKGKTGFDAFLYPVARDTFMYEFNFPESTHSATVKKTFEGLPKGNLVLRDLTLGQASVLLFDRKEKHWHFKLSPDHVYIIEKE